ncbi:MAG: flotillin-like protein FloA [Thermoguttaceae bacterium]
MDATNPLVVAGVVVGGIAFLVAGMVFYFYGSLWFQAFMSGAHVSLMNLVGMSLRQVRSRVIVQCRIMARQAGLSISGPSGITTRRLEAHFLAGGSPPNVIRAIIAAHRANLNLSFDQAAAIDLAGRDVLEAVRTSVNPKVIACPDVRKSGRTTLSAIAKNGVELLVRAQVTVRTNLDQLIGGATEDTIIARVGEGIITAIGSAETHFKVMENPDLISRQVLARGLDSQTAFQIVSIDIADIDVGQNVGARLQADQAEADTRVARARAEERRALALAIEQEMRARVAENRAKVVLNEAKVPQALATAMRTTGIGA